MFFRQILHDDRCCASYVIGCPTKAVCVVVDPQGDARTYTDLTRDNGLSITHVIDTHVHADHVSAGRRLGERVNVQVCLGERADVCYDFTPLRASDLIEVGNRRLRVLDTPGHTVEHISLYVDDWFLLTGDTLFVGGVGRVDLALAESDSMGIQGRAEILYESLQTLRRLPDQTEVYPGHYGGSSCGRGMDGKTISTIGRERRNNAALRMNPREFVEFQLSDCPPPPQEFYDIKRVNLGL